MKHFPKAVNEGLKILLLWYVLPLLALAVMLFSVGWGNARQAIALILVPCCVTVFPLLFLMACMALCDWWARFDARKPPEPTVVVPVTSGGPYRTCFAQVTVKRRRWGAK